MLLILLYIFISLVVFKILVKLIKQGCNKSKLIFLFIFLYIISILLITSITYLLSSYLYDFKLGFSYSNYYFWGGSLGLATIFSGPFYLVVIFKLILTKIAFDKNIVDINNDPAYKYAKKEFLILELMFVGIIGIILIFFRSIMPDLLFVSTMYGTFVLSLLIFGFRYISSIRKREINQ
jgi:hypothetical protein